MGGDLAGELGHDVVRRRQQSPSHSLFYSTQTVNRAAAKPLPDSDSNSLGDEIVGNGGANETDLIGNLCERPVDSAAESPTTESGSEGSSYSNENEAVVKENGESSNAKEVEPSAVKFHYRPSGPAHCKNKESPLSSDAIFKQSHAGLFNLCIVVLVAVNSRLIIENLMKYGWLMDTGFWFNPKSLGDWPLLMCCLSLLIFPLAAFLLEKLVQQKYISESVSKSRFFVLTVLGDET